MSKESDSIVVSHKVFRELVKDISTTVDYLWDEESHHYLECDNSERRNQIFLVLRRLRGFCNDIGRGGQLS